MILKHVKVGWRRRGIFKLLSCILSLPLICQVETSCNFTYTNEILQNECDFSKWLPWNCTCCGTDTVTYFLAKRLRGICCKPGEQMKPCLVRCNYTLTSDTDYGQCGSICPKPSGPSPCPYEKTTTPRTTSPTTTTQKLTTSSTTATETTQTAWTNGITPATSDISESSRHVISSTVFVSTMSSARTTTAGMRNPTQIVVPASPRTFGNAGKTITTTTSSKYTNQSVESRTDGSNRTYLIVGTVGGVLGALSVVSCCLFILIRNKTKKNKVTTDRDQPASSNGQSL